MADEFGELDAYLRRVPAIGPANEGCAFGKGRFPNGNWYVKFSIDIDHPLAWHTVQELGNVLNELSVTERLPTRVHTDVPAVIPQRRTAGVSFLGHREHGRGLRTQDVPGVAGGAVAAAGR